MRSGILLFLAMPAISRKLRHNAQPSKLLKQKARLGAPTMTEPKSTDTIMNAFFTLAIIVGISFLAITKRRS